MSTEYVSSVSVEVAEAVASSSGSADAGKLVALGSAGEVDPSMVPVATSSTIGGIKAGTGISIASDGTADVTGYLPLAGGTMTGAIAMGNNKITGLADGTASGDAVHYGQFGASIGTNGYQKLPGGLIIQWGQYNRTTVSGTSKFVTISYPIQFPNKALSISVTTGDALASCYYGADLVDSSTFAMGMVETANNQSVTLKWIAIGI